MWNSVVERKLMFLKISIDGVAVFVYNGPSGIVIHFIFNYNILLPCCLINGFNEKY